MWVRSKVRKKQEAEGRKENNSQAAIAGTKWRRYPNGNRHGCRGNMIMDRARDADLRNVRKTALGTRILEF
jgi:hypothetical protein